jgi:spore coat protein U-like protein
LATGSLGFKCSNGVPITIDLGNGGNVVGGLRGMANTGNVLAYQIYSDTNRTVVWGTGLTGGQIVNSSGTGAATSVTMYGRIPAGTTTVIEGAYQDIVVATLNF